MVYGTRLRGNVSIRLHNFSLSTVNFMLLCCAETQSMVPIGVVQPKPFLITLTSATSAHVHTHITRHSHGVHFEIRDSLRMHDRTAKRVDAALRQETRAEEAARVPPSEDAMTSLTRRRALSCIILGITRTPLLVHASSLSTNAAPRLLFRR